MLESVLMLVLLRRTGLDAAAAGRLEAFLERGQARCTGVDALLAKVALEGSGADGGRQAVEDFLQETPAFQAGSKRALISAALALAGAAADERRPSPRGVLHPAGRVQAAAVAVILRCSAGGGTATTEEAAALTAALEHDGVWEGNLLVHLLAANALSLLPGHSDQVAAAVRRALAHERVTGGLPFVSDLSVWCAVTAGIALVHTSTPRQSLYVLGDRLVGHQCSDGGWSYAAEAEHSDTDDTAVAAEFLHTLDADRYRSAIDRALNRLSSLQGDDGGFATYMPGAPSEAGMTAAALNALSCRATPHHERIGAGLDFLVRAQQTDGLFEPEWSRSRYHVAFRALLAASGAPATARAAAAQEMARRIGEAVRRGQNPDGGWGQQEGEASDAISTACALICLSAQGEPARVVEGARHLLSAQADDGGIVSILDMMDTAPSCTTSPPWPTTQRCQL
ncbi:prenyltransferase/squalene oxidase repeat-containing protein [Streptomyces sp. NPDC055815]